MAAFALAVFLLIATPGPGVLSTAGVGSGFGFAAGTRYVAGLFLGTNLVALSVIFGLAALVLADERIRTALFVLSFAYLGYLAMRIAFAGSRIAFIERARAPGIGGGILLQVINPKAYAVNTALFTGFSLVPDNYTAEVTIKLLVVNAIWIPIHLAWLWAGVSLHLLDLSERAHAVINACMATAMLAVVLIAVLVQS